jgi:type II secretory pathway predicted ATPase ExeA
VVLTGDAGSGKTMLVRRLLENLEEEVFEASMLVVLSGGADAGWMLTRFAKLLGIEEPEREREALLAQVYEQLAIVREDGRHAVLIIDDAHLLATGDTLSEVCGLLKLEYEDRRLFSLVLAGDDRLDAAIAADAGMAHRVEVKARMEPLDDEGASAYLVQRLRQAGGAPAVLEPDVVSALRSLGRGLPGRMNTLADNALFEAFLCGRQQVSRADVECAHRALGWAQPERSSAAKPAAQASPAPAMPPQPAPAAEFEVLDPIESELEAVFEIATSESDVTASRAPATHVALDGPPKEDEPEDLLIELVED